MDDATFVGMIFVFSCFMVIVCIAVAVSRRHHNIGGVVLLSLFFWPAALIWACSSGSRNAAEGYLSAADRRELDMDKANSLKRRAAELRAEREAAELVEREEMALSRTRDAIRARASRMPPHLAEAEVAKADRAAADRQRWSNLRDR